MPDDSAARLAAALAGRYTVERELGAGGMATVYLAEDLKHHRRVALKVLHPGLAEALGADRFLREIEVAARLRHPHILPLYDSGSADGLLYYVMPYAEGETLGARIARERQLPIDDALRIARETADALSYAHAHGVVHRDIKPDNILLEAGHAVVADFGIAKALSAAADEQTVLTATGTSIGTPLYMSPEQAGGEAAVDGRADLYSLACVLFEMLAGQPPFTGANAQAIVRQHMVTPPPPVTQFRPAVPAPVADALARALAKNPADRFNPVGQFATALVDVAVPPSGPARTPRRIAPLAWAGGAAVLLVLIAAALFARRGADGPPSVAVLPFEITGSDTAATAFAAGIHGELVTELTRIPGLRVASRGSVIEYAGSDRPQREIANELGVGAILMGTMQRAGDQVRLTMSLSDPSRGEELWAERYDRRLTAENLFALQAEVAREVAGVLRVRFAPPDSAMRPPTDDLAALELYYEAEQLWSGRTSQAADSVAVDLAERAVTLDPRFARAWALLTHLRAWRVRSGASVDTIPARDALARTLELAPGSLEAHLAEGYYSYYARADFRRALAAVEAASELTPASADLLALRGLLERRLGRWDAALTNQQRSVEMEPRRVPFRTQLNETLTMVRRPDDALASLAAERELVPRSGNVRSQQLELLLDVIGDTAGARRLLAEAQPLFSPFQRAVAEHGLAYSTRDTAAIRRIIPDLDDGIYANIPNRHLLRAVLAHATGNTAERAAHADSLRRFGQRHVARITAGADPFGLAEVAQMQIALADALDGRAAAAVERAAAAAARLSRSRDAVDGGQLQYWLAQVYALAGRHDDAIRTLTEVLAHPGLGGAGDLRLNPVWDPLRADPAFARLVSATQGM